MVATICASVLSAVNAGITKRLLPVGEVSLTHYQASLDPYDKPEVRIELDAATAGAQLDPVSEDEHIVGVDDFEGLVLDPFPSLAHVSDPFSKPSVTLVGTTHPGGLPLARGLYCRLGANRTSISSKSLRTEAPQPDSALRRSRARRRCERGGRRRIARESAAYAPGQRTTSRASIVRPAGNAHRDPQAFVRSRPRRHDASITQIPG